MFAEISPRVYDVFTILHGAALVDPHIADLERELRAQRPACAGRLAGTLADRFGITAATSTKRAGHDSFGDQQIGSAPPSVAA